MKKPIIRTCYIVNIAMIVLSIIGGLLCSQIGIRQNAEGDGTTFASESELGTIGGRMWEDKNINGQLDEGEAGVAGITVQLFNSFEEPRETVTDQNGVYEFSELPAGSYSIFPQHIDWSFTPETQTIALVAGQQIRNVNFTGFKLGIIGGYKWEDKNQNGVRDNNEPRLIGWSICIGSFEDGIQTYIRCTETGVENGLYQFCGLKPGKYVVYESVPHGWKPTTPPDGEYPSVSVETSGFEKMDMNFGNVSIEEDSGYIAGWKWNDKNHNAVWDTNEQGVGKWRINIYVKDGQDWKFDGAVLTDTDGFYRFEGLIYGKTYKVVEELKEEGWRLTYPNKNEYIIEIKEGYYRGPYNFGNAELGKISGVKYEDRNKNGEKDLNEDGLPGWEIVLKKTSSGEVVATRTTDEYGYFQFDKLKPDTYIISETAKPGWSQTYPKLGSHELHVDLGDSWGADFGNYTELRGEVYNGEPRFEKEDKSITITIPGQGSFTVWVVNNTSKPIKDVLYVIHWTDWPEDVVFWKSNFYTFNPGMKSFISIPFSRSSPLKK